MKKVLIAVTYQSSKGNWYFANVIAKVSSFPINEDDIKIIEKQIIYKLIGEEKNNYCILNIMEMKEKI